jgi:hypothetical protein
VYRIGHSGRDILHAQNRRRWRRYGIVCCVGVADSSFDESASVASVCAHLSSGVASVVSTEAPCVCVVLDCTKKRMSTRAVPYDAGARLWADALQMPDDCFDPSGRRVVAPPATPATAPDGPEVVALRHELRSLEEENALLKRHLQLLAKVYQKTF